MRLQNGFMDVFLTLCAMFVPPIAALYILMAPNSILNFRSIPEKPQVQIVEVKQRNGCWTEAGWYSGGRLLSGGKYTAKGMVCAANMPELGIRRGDSLMISRVGFCPIVCRVNDFGPDRNVFPGRGIDLSPDAADALGMRSCGISKVYVMILR